MTAMLIRVVRGMFRSRHYCSACGEIKMRARLRRLQSIHFAANACCASLPIPNVSMAGQRSAQMCRSPTGAKCIDRYHWLNDRHAERQSSDRQEPSYWRESRPRRCRYTYLCRLRALSAGPRIMPLGCRLVSSADDRASPGRRDYRKQQRRSSSVAICFAHA